DIISEVIRLNLKIVHIQHEVFVFGKKQHIYPYLCIVMIAILRLLGVKVVCTIHGVVSARNVSEDFSKSNKVIAPLFLIKLGLSFMYKLTCAFSNAVIVHNEKLSNVLQEEYLVKKDKVYVVPHPLYKYTSLGKKPSVFKSLPVGKKTVLFFGFLAPYKGLDTLIDSAISDEVKKDENVVFLVVGSTPRRYTDDDSYISWLNELKNLSLGNKNIIWVHDYIPDEEVGDYFKNSDLIVIPYNEAMSASGPLSIAIYYEKPVLVSKPFSGVVQEDLIYGSNAGDLGKSVLEFFSDSNYNSVIQEAVSLQKGLWSDEVIIANMEKIYKNLSE
ncbi:MAG: glycosyltransferase, partial [Gottschalkiaceae bacterium]